MDILGAMRLYFWAVAGGLVALLLLYIAVAGFVQGAKRDAVALSLMSLASALIGGSLYRMAGGDEGGSTAVAGLSGLALLVLTVRLWKPEPDHPPAQVWRPLRKRRRDKRNRRRNKSA